MVRAPSGPTPRGVSMNSRNTIKRKNRPCFEALERKQLLSAAQLTNGAQAISQPVTPVSSHVQQPRVIADGTGKGIFIITH
jgi:hypothetical protein